MKKKKNRKKEIRERKNYDNQEERKVVMQRYGLKNVLDFPFTYVNFQIDSTNSWPVERKGQK